MCGIAGFVEPRARLESELVDVATRMGERLAHRGPDASGTWVDANAGVGLSHRRLAVIEPSALGAQPMRSAHGRFIVVFNGEIYDFPALRDELRSLGHSFRGGSDTEVILAASEEWGVRKAITRLMGMFALAIWDRAERTLTLARDRLGEKPLYYGWSGESFLFASELKAMCVHPSWEGRLNPDALVLYFRGNYVPAPYSIYTGIWKLPPGTLIQLPAADLSRGHLPKLETYWALPQIAADAESRSFAGSETQAIDALDALLGDVVEGQMIADVPVGAFLSGGIDSSLVVALMRRRGASRIRTFTIGSDEPAFDESNHARAVARHLGTEHTEHVVSAADALSTIGELPQIYDEPFADASQIPTYLVARLARKHVTVCLTGDGGDEVFGGYNRQVRLLAFWQRLRHVPRTVRLAIGRVLDTIPASMYDAVLRHLPLRVLADQVHKFAAIVGMDDPRQMYRSLATQWSDADTLVKGAVAHDSAGDADYRLKSDLAMLLMIETMTSLPDDMLVKVDRAAMALGLETRVPLVDARVVEFAYGLPDHLKVRGHTGKWILRGLLDRYVPRHLVDRPKAGFSIPLDHWLRTSLRDWAESLLAADRLSSEGFLDAAIIRQRWEEHLTGRRKWQYQLWSVLMFEAWLDHHKRQTPVTQCRAAS